MWKVYQNTSVVAGVIRVTFVFVNRPITLKHQSSGMCTDSNIKLNILYSMEQIRGVNVSEISLLFDPSPLIYWGFF